MSHHPAKRARLEPAAEAAASSASSAAGAEDVLEEDRWAEQQSARRAAAAMSDRVRIKCPFLDTINTTVLDFDLPKECSVTLEKENAYMCLVCGQLFRGRGKQTPAYTHSAAAGHHVFINLRTARFYCLPDGYEVVDSSLDGIKRALCPQYSREEVAALDTNTTLRTSQLGIAYLPGFVGLNNLKKTDFVNSTLQALCHVEPLRDFFVAPEHVSVVRDECGPLVACFGDMIRKMWSPHNFKNCVGPHALIDAISVASKKRFGPGHRASAVEFLAWLLHELHRGLKGKGSRAGRSAKGSIITDVFQGQVEVTTETAAGEADAEVAEGGAAAGGAAAGAAPTVQRPKFLFLSLELPATPLFRDAQGANIIPQVPLFDVLEKYDGEKVTVEVVNTGLTTEHRRKRYSLLRLPQYLILHMKRFTKNNWFVEKNGTIVNFPVRNLELKDYLKCATPTSEELGALSVKRLKSMLLRTHGFHATKNPPPRGWTPPWRGMTEKRE